VKVPRLDAKPQLHDGVGSVGLNPYIRAYQILSRSRQIGMAEFYIPLTEILAYLDLIEMTDQQEREEFALIIMAIDAALLDHKAKKDKQDEELLNKASPRKTP